VSTPATPPARRLPEHQLFFALSIVVGVLAGLSAVVFTLSIERTSRALFGLDPSHARVIAVPALVGIVTGILLARFFPDSRGSGVPQTRAVFHRHGGVMSPLVPFGTFITGVLGIGSGQSLGREGPSIQIGAGIASVIGKWLRLPPIRVKQLVPIGAAAGLAAAFNTPVTAVLFTFEEIIGDLNAALIGATVLASVSAVIVARAILGNDPLFNVPIYTLVHPGELVAYGVLGVLGGGLSVGFCRGLLRLRAVFIRLPRWTRVWQPAIGGVAVGALLLVRPEVMGVGYEYVNQALNGGLMFRTLLTLGVVKMAATLISYCSGNTGGIFAPTLFIGAMTGGALGTLVHAYAPFPSGGPGAYAMVGMGALFAGIIRAPITSVVMVFELTQDYEILVPLMVANLLSFVISRRYQPMPVYRALLQQDAIAFPASASPNVAAGL
jgi:CIC family chloride channel protein